MHLLGIDWVGVNAENGRKLVLSLALTAVVFLLGALLRRLLRLVFNRGDNASRQVRFWTRQGISLFTALLLILGWLSIWFNDPTRLATAFGLVSAGLAFALQQVVTSVAGYFVILRGENFTVGDRISMGGVRGDVIRLGFIQTTILEMGQPGDAQGQAGMWIRSRQFTGRIVTVSNSKIFSDPVFNYTRDFPFIWEEMMIPLSYKADRRRAEAILLRAATRHALDLADLPLDAVARLQHRYGIEPVSTEPQVFFRLTDNWLEMTVRFVVGTHRIRMVKDAMSRDIIEAFDEAGIGLASATYDIVGLPPIELRRPSRAPAEADRSSGPAEAARTAS